MWIKNTAGEKSVSLTMTLVTFVVVIFWMVISIFENPFGVKTVPFDATAAMTVLSPLLALYWGRRHSDTKLKEKKEL